MRALEYALRMQAAMGVRRRKLRKWPRPRFPSNERLLYYRQLAHIVDVEHAIVRGDLLPALPTILDPHNAMRPEATARADAAEDDIEKAFAQLEASVATAIPERAIFMLSQQAALRTSRWQASDLARQIQQVAKINLYDDVTGIADHLDLFVSENVELVTGMVEEHLADLKGILIRAARQGLHHTVVAEQIQTRFEMPKKRAALIASDQIGKLNGELNQLRQQNLGIRRYRWSTSRDEKVRHDHRVLEGTIQEWAKPPVVNQRTGERGHPGQPIRCRCSAIPIVDDVLVAAGLMAPEDVELDYPEPTLPAVPPGFPQPPPANVPSARRR